ncbi:MAG TPA: shikimate kinase [Tepidisphaeraceae bacterium]|jgi:shikimate kinase|nr:shikimate kinase [Tepidisphaeraceae bacterium]
MEVGLIGYRGCGKSTVGKLLAARLSLAFIDTDARIVQRAGKTIRDIFQQDGEPAFRNLESQIVREAIDAGSAVIAFGGGAIDREQNQTAIKNAGLKLIYLKCEPVELLRRIEADPGTAGARPHLTSHGGSLAEIQTVLTRREPIWRTLLTAEIDVTRLTPGQAVKAILNVPGI